MTKESTTAPGEGQLAVRGSEEISLAPNKAFLRKSQAELEQAVALYPEPVRIDTVWAQGFCREECNGNIELLRAVCEKLGFKLSYSFFYNALNGYSYKPGKGKGDPGYWREIVAALRDHDRTSTAAGKRGFIETPTYRCISQFIDERRAPNAPCKFGIITGATGTQKTACRKYYRTLNNHGKVVGFEASARNSIVSFQRKLAEQYSAKIGRNAAAREEAIRDNVNEMKTIILDNAQRLFFHNQGNRQPVFDYLLELQEDANCTVILFVTEDFVKGDLTQGAARNYFEQLVGRFGGMGDILRLPDFAPRSDLRCIARAYGLKDSAGAMEFLQKWSRLPGRVRIVFHRLNRAKNFAAADGRDRITIADLQEANDYVPPAIGDDDEGGAS